MGSRCAGASLACSRRGQRSSPNTRCQAQLNTEYARAALFVSPLLNATGIATKNFHAMAIGLPVLTTAMGTSGLMLPPHRVPLCCDGGASPVGTCTRRASESAGFAAHVSRLSLVADCRLHPTRMECQAYQAAIKAATRQAAGSRVLLIGGGGGGQEGGPDGEPEWRPTASHGMADRTGPSLPATLPAELLLAVHLAETPAGVAGLRTISGRGGAESAASRDERRPSAHPALHPSGAMLVEDAPLAFARAAIDALHRPRLWDEVSRTALRHQRMLSVARQSGVVGEVLRDALLLEPPAEQACVLVAEASDRANLLGPLAALTRLRIAVHLVLLPSATAASEALLLGSSHTQVHPYLLLHYLLRQADYLHRFRSDYQQARLHWHCTRSHTVLAMAQAHVPRLHWHCTRSHAALALAPWHTSMLPPATRARAAR